MSNLEKENEILKTELDSLRRENEYLKNQLNKALSDNKLYIEGFHFKKIHMEIEPKPILFLDERCVEFKRKNSGMVRLLSALLQSSTIKEMKNAPIPISEIFDLIHGDDSEGSWFSFGTHDEEVAKVLREKAKDEIRQLFRNINNETKGILDGKKLFIAKDNGFMLNNEVIKK